MKMRGANKYWLLMLSMLLVVFIAYEVVHQETKEEKIVTIENNLSEAKQILNDIENDKYPLVEQLNGLQENDKRREYVEGLLEQYSWKAEVLQEMVSAMQGMKMQLFLYESYTSTYLQNELRYYKAMVEGIRDEEIFSDYYNVYKLYNLDASIYMTNHRTEHLISENTIIWQNIWNSIVNILSSIYIFVPLLFGITSFGVMKNLSSTVFSFLPKTYSEIFYRELRVGVCKSFGVLLMLLCCVISLVAINIGEIPRVEDVLYYNSGLQEFSFINPLFLIVLYVIMIILVTTLIALLKDLMSIHFEDTYLPLLMALFLTYFIIYFPDFLWNDKGALFSDITTFRQLSSQMGGYFSWEQWCMYVVYISAILFIFLKIHKLQFEKLRKRK